MFYMKTVIKSNGQSYSVREDRSKFFFPGEWKRFYDTLKPKQRPTFDILINTGARINEARNINPSMGDVDYENCRINLRVTKHKTVGRKAKLGSSGVAHARMIPVSSQFMKRYKHYVKEGFRFLSTPAANIALKNALFRAGFAEPKLFSVHNVRKTFEVWLLALDVDSLKVVKHLGHSMVVAARHYVSPDSFTFDEKDVIRNILGDIYKR